MTKFFAVSDLHGHYDEFIACLGNTEYDEANPNHKVIMVGDWTDRGTQCAELYKYLHTQEALGKCIVLAGNHDEMLLEFLDGGEAYFHIMYNGLAATIGSLAEYTTRDYYKEVGEDNALLTDWLNRARKIIVDKYPELAEWLRNLPYYYETENHIFTHGSIQGYGNWKEPDISWRQLLWDDGSFFHAPILNTDKKIVVGHFGTAELRRRNGLSEEEDHSILCVDDQKIFIDGCTVLTKNVNVLVVDDEEICSN